MFFLVLAATAMVLGRILIAPPGIAPNDQSRWMTIRAIAERGTYVIGTRTWDGPDSWHDRGFGDSLGWRTIDRVLDPRTNNFYSTKPTLLPTLLAGEYWLLRNGLGWTVLHEPRLVIRTILLTINWLPFAIGLVLLARLAMRFSRDDWSRAYVITMAGFGTYLTTYMVTLNNHTVAAAAVVMAMYCYLRIRADGQLAPWRYALTGALLGWTACNELPAASFLVAMLILLWRFAPRETLRITLPAALVPIGAYFATQYVAFGSIIPTYARGAWYEYAGSYWLNPTGIDAAVESPFVYAFNLLIGHMGIFSLTPAFALSAVGVAMSLRNPFRTLADTRLLWSELAWLTLSLTTVTFVFYVADTNNYGGVTAGPRWLFWLIPLWLLMMLPALDRFVNSGRFRAVAATLLTLSVASAVYAASNPWQSSWLLRVFRHMGWVQY